MRVYVDYTHWNCLIETNIMTTLNYHYSIEDEKHHSLNYFILHSDLALPQWLELLMSRTIFNGPKDVWAINVLLLYAFLVSCCFTISPYLFMPSRNVWIPASASSLCFLMTLKFSSHIRRLKYSKTSMTRTPIDRLSWMIRTRFLGPYDILRQLKKINI